jgi:hypothetical protein
MAPAAGPARIPPVSPRLASLLLLALAGLLVGGCDDPVEPDPPPVVGEPTPAPVALNWVLSGADPDALDAAVDAAAALAPSAVILGGGLAPALFDGQPDAGTEAALAAFSADTPMGLELPALGSDAPDALCLDPADPAAEPYLTGRASRLSTFLAEHPAVRDLSVAPAGPPAPWDRDCTCEPCDADGLPGQLRAAFAGAVDAVGGDVSLRWWDALDPGAPPDEATSSMDAALAALPADALPSLRSSSIRGPDHPWAPLDPQLLQSAGRELSADLDLSCPACGPTDAPLVFADALHDRMLRTRARGVSTWFASVDGGSFPPWGRLEEANLYLAARWVEEPHAAPEVLLQRWVVERWGLEPGTPAVASLADALRASGRAWALATHPLGIAVADTELGVQRLPIDFVDPRPWQDGWDVRWQELTSPGGQTLVDVNQWGAEAVALAEAAIAAFEDGEPALPAAEAAALRRRFAVLGFAARAWKLALGADLTLKVYLADPQAQRARWIRQDATDLEELADEVQAALDAGDIDTAFPADPEVLSEIALQLRNATGDGSEAERPFPVITAVRWDFEDDRTNIRWTLRPPGSGWWERGPGWPAPYDTSSAIGAGPSEIWNAWTSSLGSGDRVPFRACGEAGGYRVCSADAVLWIGAP